jgi:hypothetical protein
MSVPQDVPFGIEVPLSTQLADPPAQVMVPVWQAFGGLQLEPAEQAWQAPPLQTLPVPQLVPSAMLPDSMHNALPVLHVSVPVRHGLATVHDSPTLQAMHMPCPQTLSLPHAVPSGTAVC